MAVEQEIKQGGVWEMAKFSVPIETPDERVQMVAGEYMKRAGEGFRKQGFTVHEMKRPQVSNLLSFTAGPGRKTYYINVFVSRRPNELTIPIPDYAVLEMQKAGLKLIE